MDDMERFLPLPWDLPAVKLLFMIEARWIFTAIANYFLPWTVPATASYQPTRWHYKAKTSKETVILLPRRCNQAKQMFILGTSQSWIVTLPPANLTATAKIAPCSDFYLCRGRRRRSKFTIAGCVNMPSYFNNIYFCRRRRRPTVPWIRKCPPSFIPHSGISVIIWCHKR